MATDVRVLAAIGALVLVALALCPNVGFYTLPGMIAMLLAAALVIGTCLGRDRTVAAAPSAETLALCLPAVAGGAYLLWAALRQKGLFVLELEIGLGLVGVLAGVAVGVARVRAANLVQSALIGAGVFLTGTTALLPQLRYGMPWQPDLNYIMLAALLACTVAMYALWLSFLAQPQAGARWRGWCVRWGLMLLVGGTIRVLAVVGSPDPVIDVHTWLENAPRFLLQGQNPYPARYPSPYGTEHAHRMHIYDAPAEHIGAGGYAPGAILTALPAVVLGFDVRYINVAADVLAAVCILLVGMRCGARETGLLASGLYLCLPRAAYMTEQSWYEPQLAAALGLFALWMPRRRWAAGLALGALFGLKQYVALMVPALWQICRRHWRVFVGAAAVGAAIYLPFVLWDPPAFWWYALVGHLHWPTIYYTYIVASLFKNEWGIIVPNNVMWAISIVLILALAWRTPQAGKGPWVLWLAASMLVFNLCSTQGFPNYFYLVEFLLLLGVAQSGTGAGMCQAPEAPVSQ